MSGDSGHGGGIGFAGKVFVFAIGVGVLALAANYALQAYRYDCVKFGNCVIAVPDTQQQRPSFQGVTPAPGYASVPPAPVQAQQAPLVLRVETSKNKDGSIDTRTTTADSRCQADPSKGESIRWTADGCWVTRPGRP